MRIFAVVFYLLALLIFIGGCGGGGGSQSVPAQATLIGQGTESKALSLTGSLSILAGTAGAYGASDGSGSAARFYDVGGITSDGQNLYVTDGVNNTIRKVVISTGSVTTLAGTAAPGTSGSADGTKGAASFNGPTGITTDGTNVYVTDQYNNTIRKIVISTGEVTTLAGKAGVTGSTDGIGVNATFYHPTGISTDGTSLYVVDSYNRTVRKIVLSSGAVTTLAGTANSGEPSSNDGTGPTASFSNINGITTDGKSLYVVDAGNSILIRKIALATGVVSTLAGSAGAPRASVDGTGSAANFYSALGITTDGTSLFVPDIYNHSLVIRRISLSTATVTTINLTPGFVDTTSGVANEMPFGIATDGNSLFIGNGSNTAICMIQ